MFDARIRYFRQSTAIVLFRPLQPSGDCKKLSIYSHPFSHTYLISELNGGFESLQR